LLRRNELKAADYDSLQADFILIPACNEIDSSDNETITMGIESSLPECISFLP
jgi:hypothetical protein